MLDNWNITERDQDVFEQKYRCLWIKTQFDR